MSSALAGLVIAWTVHGDARAESPAIRRANYQTATGTLTSYDPGTRMLTVRSAAGAKEFRVSADARLWLGRRAVPVSQLSSRVGAEVTVAWSDVDGVRTTHTVRVSEPRPAGGR